MTEQPPTTPTTPSSTSGRFLFDERLSVPWWWYLPAVGVGVLLGAEIHLGYSGVRSWIGYVVCVPLLVAALFLLGRTRVRVTETELQVGGTSVARSHLGRADVVERAGKQEALGPQLDPAARLLHRVWVGPVVRVEVTDPDDRTPYWIFSVRRPDRLLAALDR